MTTLRRANAFDDDVQALVYLGYYHSLEPWSDPRLLPSSPGEAARLWRDAVIEHYVMIAEKYCRPIGVVLGYHGVHHFNPAVRTLTCGMWYAHGPHRHRALLMLLYAFTEHGRRTADVTYFDLVSHVGTDSLLRLGYAPIERNFARWSAPTNQR